jgi:hypothetical protein
MWRRRFAEAAAAWSGGRIRGSESAEISCCHSSAGVEHRPESKKPSCKRFFCAQARGGGAAPEQRRESQPAGALELLKPRALRSELKQRACYAAAG